MFHECSVKNDAFSLNDLKMMDNSHINSCEIVCGGTNHCQGLFSLGFFNSFDMCSMQCPVTFV